MCVESTGGKTPWLEKISETSLRVTPRDGNQEKNHGVSRVLVFVGLIPSWPSGNCMAGSCFFVPLLLSLGGEREDGPDAGHHVEGEALGVVGGPHSVPERVLRFLYLEKGVEIHGLESETTVT